MTNKTSVSFVSLRVLIPNNRLAIEEFRRLRTALGWDRLYLTLGFRHHVRDRDPTPAESKRSAAGLPPLRRGDRRNLGQLGFVAISVPCAPLEVNYLIGVLFDVDSA